MHVQWDAGFVETDGRGSFGEGGGVPGPGKSVPGGLGKKNPGITMRILVAAVISYLVGSIPFSFLIARKVRHVDLRTAGEGNVGGRNVWHVVGKKYGVLAGCLDFLKGVAALGIGRLAGLPPLAVWICGFSAVIGHGFPIFLRGRGGKGAATALGFLFALNPLMIFLSGLLMGAAFGVSRNFHVAISLGMASIPFFWRFALGRSWMETGILLAFLLLLGLKRVIDAPYMRKIRKTSGWQHG